MKGMEQDGHTAMLVGVDGRLLGIVALMAVARGEATETADIALMGDGLDRRIVRRLVYLGGPDAAFLEQVFNPIMPAEMLFS